MTGSQASSFHWLNGYLIEVSRRVQEIIGRELPGQVMKAGQWNRRYKVPHAVEERLTALVAAS